MAIDHNTLTKAIPVAIQAGKEFTHGGRSWGCARVYICFTEKFTKTSKVAKTLEQTGYRVTKRPYSTRNHLYIGYDNGTGNEWYKAESIAKVFNEHGISCYVDADEE